MYEQKEEKKENETATIRFFFRRNGEERAKGEGEHKEQQKRATRQ